MRREPSWKVRLPIALAAMAVTVLVSRSLIVHGAELPKHRAVVIKLTMHREKGPAPKYVHDDKVRKVVVPIARPAGAP